MDIYEFLRLINGSLRYEIDGTILTLTGYYSGKAIRLDLSKITADMLEEITVEADGNVLSNKDDSDEEEQWWQK